MRSYPNYLSIKIILQHNIFTYSLQSYKLCWNTIYSVSNYPHKSPFQAEKSLCFYFLNIKYRKQKSCSSGLWVDPHHSFFLLNISLLWQYGRYWTRTSDPLLVEWGQGIFNKFRKWLISRLLCRYRFITKNLHFISFPADSGWVRLVPLELTTFWYSEKIK
jgi:hypothetical protein